MSVASTKTALPWRILIVMCLCDASHFYSVCSLFSYAGIMAADVGWAEDRDHAGFIAGFLPSANVWGRVAAGTCWGLASARYGYKAVMLVTLLSIGAGGVAFGLCSNLYLALASRFVCLGLGNGWVAIFGPLSAEAAGDAMQTRVTGIVMGAGSFVQLVGPALGGWTYGAVPEFPAAVPSMLGTLLACIAMAACCRWMPWDVGSSEPKRSVEGVVGDAEAPGEYCYSAMGWPMPLILVMRFLGPGITAFSMFELLPLWAISSEGVGGLALSEEELGLFLSRTGLWQVFFFTILMPKISERIGLRRFAMLASAVAGVSAVVLPLATTTMTANIVHMLAMSTNIAEGAMGMALTNNVVAREQRSAINGIAVTIETLGKALGPLVAAPVFAWSIATWGRDGRFLVFSSLAAAHLIYFCGACALPPFADGVPAPPPPRDARTATGGLEAAAEAEAALPPASVVGAPALPERRDAEKAAGASTSSKRACDVEAEQLLRHDPSSLVPPRGRNGWPPGRGIAPPEARSPRRSWGTPA